MRPSKENFKNLVTVYCVRENKKRLQLRDEFFNGETIIRDNGSSLIFKKPSLGFLGKTHRSKFYTKDRCYFLHITSEIPVGNYTFDEFDSNEDIKVIYYSENKDL